MTEVSIQDEGGQDAIKLVHVGLDGYLLPNFTGNASVTKAVFDSVSYFECRPDDVMLATYPKCGTNWMYEILTMILNKSSERVPSIKMNTMLESLPAEEVNKVASPRVLNSHLMPRYLPFKSMKAKGVKTILCYRNPKDAAVSYFHHTTGVKIYDYAAGKWQNWIGPYSRGEYEYGKQSDYLNEWQQVIEDGTGFPIHIMCFEDLKKDGVKEIDKLVRFLEVELDDQLKADIIDMCGFDKMKKEKMPKDPEFIKNVMNNDFFFFRKGEVGDWKNWFTVSQDELFEATWNKEIRKDTMFKFQYV